MGASCSSHVPASVRSLASILVCIHVTFWLLSMAIQEAHDQLTILFDLCHVSL